MRPLAWLDLIAVALIGVTPALADPLYCSTSFRATASARTRTGTAPPSGTATG
jgi:hypothetical protein